MKNLLIPLFSLLVIGMCGETWAEELRGKFALGGMGGACYTMGNGFSTESTMKNNYGFGLSAEFFFFKALSGGLSLVHNSFQGSWEYRGFYPYSDHYYSSDWAWTNISIFAKFVIGPQSKISPYLKAGAGLCIPRIKDWWYNPPDTVQTHTSYEKGVFGYHLGFGIHYLLNRKVLVYMDIPFNVISTDKMEQTHRIGEQSYYFNIFVGFSFLFGTGRLEQKAQLR